MFVEDTNGDLTNLDHVTSIIRYQTVVEANRGERQIELFQSDNPADCQAYMAELKAELYARGKLIKVEIKD